MDNNEKLFTPEERELFEKYNKFKELYKGYSKLTFEYFKQFMINNETLKNNGEPHLTYDQWYHTIKEHEYTKHLKREEHRANKQLIDNIENEKNEFEQLQSEYLGKFYFHFYNETLMLDIAPQYLVRFAYLCCYLDYNDNKIYFGKSNNKLAIEKDLKEIWKLGKDETRYTKNALIDKGLIKINEDKTISVNKKYALKGNINNDKKLRGGVKMFECGIKELYENSKAIEHKRLGILMKLLPCVNYEYNVLCANPTETTKSKIIPLTMKDICRIVEYDESQSKRLQKELIKIRIDNKAVVMVHTTSGMNTGETEAISINPMVYYKGHNSNALGYLLMLFDILDK